LHTIFKSYVFWSIGMCLFLPTQLNQNLICLTTITIHSPIFDTFRCTHLIASNAWRDTILVGMAHRNYILSFLNNSSEDRQQAIYLDFQETWCKNNIFYSGPSTCPSGNSPSIVMCPARGMYLQFLCCYWQAGCCIRCHHKFHHNPCIKVRGS